MGVGVNGNLIPPEKGEVRNPKGKPKGAKHLSTWIHELLNDENFTTMVQDGLKIKEYKGAPIKAIIGAQIRLAVHGDTKAFDVLARHGYGTKLNITPGDPVEALLKEYGINKEADDGQADTAMDRPPQG